MKRYSLHCVLGLLCFFVAGCAGGPVAAKRDTSAKIVLLYVSDLHSQIVEDHDDLGGYARLAQYIKSERENAGPHTDVVVVIGGDLFGKGRVPCRETNDAACAPLVSALTPDVVSFGNGELKFPNRELAKLAEKTGGTWIGTNVASVRGAKFWKASHTYVGTKSGVSLAFVSNTVFPGPGEARGGSQFDFAPTETFDSEYLAATKSGAAPIVIVHDDKKTLETLAPRLCAQAVKPLLVLKAHEHLEEQGKVECLKYVEAGSFGRQVARVEIRKGAPSVDKVDLVKMDAKIPADPALRERIAGLYKSAGHQAHRVLVKLNSARDQDHVAKFLALSYQKTSKADIAIVNSGAVKDGLPAGQIDWEMLMNVIPYNNQLMGLDWSTADLEKSLCLAARREKDRRLDNGADLVFFGAELKDAGKDKCRLVVNGGKRNPKIVVDSYMVARSARWLGKELKGKTFSYGLDTERAVELGVERYGAKEL
ncbi:MAG TPA: 5'-nucleotidase C-terminal domain-containing protein [Bdellovibrionota bacterium]|jgi:2',3'-cyclic-nucleotide 2'-phosphodiesterase (5'-nucleotidase family)|nr:5'-nucleotidase C-terminal domain-containing protein [Bdellovibrionota bacterium]